MKKILLLSALTLGVAGWSALQTYAVDAPKPAATQKADEDEVPMKLEECPKAVQDTIKKEVGAGKIDKLVKETEKGKTIYSVDATIGGKPFEINVAEDGTLISNKPDDEKEDDEKEEKGEHKH